MEWVTPGLPRIRCTGYGMGHACVTEAGSMNGSRLGYRGWLDALGTEWVTPGLPRMARCSGYGMGHA